MVTLTPIERKAHLVLKRTRYSDIARQLGCTQSHVGQVAAGKRRSDRVERAIARAIGMPLEKVFPRVARNYNPMYDVETGDFWSRNGDDNPREL